MFNIDLLKGSGIPVKSRPQGLLVTAIAFFVPALVATILIGMYVYSSILITLQNKEISNYDVKIKNYAAAVELQKKFQKEKKSINTTMDEAGISVTRHSQVSSLLQAVAVSMPDSMILTNLKYGQQFERVRVKDKNDPLKMVDAEIPVRTLHLAVSGNAKHNCDRAIKNLSEKLKNSELLQVKPDDIRISQELNTIDGQSIINYDIVCIFKQGI